MNKSKISKQRIVAEAVQSMHGSPFTYQQLYHRALELNRMFGHDPWRYEDNIIIRDKLQKSCNDKTLEVFINTNSVYFRERNSRF